jgi:uncharacterized RDD family membrane protein YckC
MSSLPEGWYKDPADPATQRWWDGEGWVGKAIPADQTPPPGPPPAEEPPAPEPAAPQTPQTPADPTRPVPPGAPAQPGTPTQPGPPFAPWAQPGQHPQPGPQQWPAPGAYPTYPPGAQAPGHPGQPWPQPGQPWPPAGPFGYSYSYAIPQIHPHGLALAGLGRRLVARIIDIFFVAILVAIVNSWFAYQWWLEVAPVVRAAMNQPIGQAQASARADYLMLTMLVVATALWFAYEVPALANSGQTLGKWICRVKVFRVESTDAIGFGRAFRRWARLGLWTPFWSCFGLGFLLQAIDSLSPVFDPRLRQALHDKTAGTVVVAVPAGYRTPVQATDPSSGGER